MSTKKGARRDDTTQGTGQATGEASLEAAGAAADHAQQGPSYRRLSDPRELAALAHPVRLGIMELLTVAGPLTATELADRLDETPANCSWHLRKLAEHSLRRGGRRRDRPAAALAGPLGRAGLGRRRTPRPASCAPGRALEEMLLQRQVTRFHQARAQLLDDGEREWADAASQHPARQLADRSTSSTSSTSRSAPSSSGTPTGSTDPAQRPPGSRLCEFVAWGAPLLLPGVEATPDAGSTGRG